MGAIGTGKSTEALRTFQDSYYISNKDNNHHYFKKWLRTKGAESGLKLPKKVNLIDVYQTGVSKEDYSDELNLTPIKFELQSDGTKKRIRVSQQAALEAKLDLLLAQATDLYEKGEPQKYKHVIIDEMGTFINRVFDEIAPFYKTQNGQPNPLKSYPALGAWARGFTDIARQFTPLGIGVCLVFHDREPTEGKKGGIDAPGGIREQMARDSDGVIQRLMKDSDTPGAPAERWWCATASEQWHRKLVGLEPEDEPRIRSLDLKTILTEFAGYTV